MQIAGKSACKNLHDVFSYEGQLVTSRRKNKKNKLLSFMEDNLKRENRIFSEYLSSPFFHPPSFSTALRIPFAPLFLGRGNKLTFGKYVSVNSTRSNRIENVKNLDILPRWIFTSFLDIRSHLSCSTQSKTNRFDVNRLSLSFPPLFFFLKTEIQSLSEFHFDQHFSLFGILSYFKKKKKERK